MTQFAGEGEEVGSSDGGGEWRAGGARAAISTRSCVWLCLSFGRHFGFGLFCLCDIARKRRKSGKSSLRGRGLFSVERLCVLMYLLIWGDNDMARHETRDKRQVSGITLIFYVLHTN